MDLGIISVRYAKALLRFATENDEADTVYNEMEQLADTFLKVEALHQTLQNPVISDKQRKQLLLAAAQNGKKKCSKSYTRFIELLIRKKRADLMNFVAHSYGTLYRKEKHIIKGKLTLPAHISKDVIKKLRKLAEARSGEKVDFQVEEDAQIGGGFILQYDTYCLDASVRTNLAKIHRELA